MADLASNQAIVDIVNSKAAEYEALSIEYLEELLSLANKKIYNTMGRVYANIDEPRQITLGALSSLPSDRPKVNVPAFVFNPEDYLTTDLLGKYTYESEFFTYLDPKIKEFIDTETAFIDQTVQDALFQQTRERDLQTLNDSVDAAERREATRGFPCPTSMFMAARNELIKKYQDTMAGRNKEITALIAERAHDGRKHYVDAGIRMEDIRSRFQLEYGRLYFQVAEYLVRKFQADVSAETARVSSEIEMLKLKAEIDMRMVASDEHMNSAHIDSVKTTATQLIEDAKLDLDIKKTKAEMEMNALSGIVQFYKDIHAGYTGQMNGINLVTSSAE